MILKELQEKLNLSVQCAEKKTDQVITGGYVSDLLSDVIANAQEGEDTLRNFAMVVRL